MTLVVRSLSYVRSKPVLYRLLGMTRLALFRAKLAYREWHYIRRAAAAIDQDMPLPPPGPRFRIGQPFDAAIFLHVGAVCPSSIKAVAGRDPSTFRSVLDFACGCVRVIR